MTYREKMMEVMVKRGIPLIDSVRLIALDDHLKRHNQTSWTSDSKMEEWLVADFEEWFTERISEWDKPGFLREWTEEMLSVNYRHFPDN